MEKVIQLIVYVVLVYFFIGIVFSGFFYRTGMRKIDKATSGSSFGFKLIIFPGIVVFWPILLSKWIKQN